MTLLSNDRVTSSGDSTREWFTNLPQRARDFLLEARRQGRNLYDYTRRLSHAERHTLFTRAPGRVVFDPPSPTGGSSVGGSLAEISLSAPDVWAVMGLVSREWYLRRASYYQLFRQHARLYGVEDVTLGDSVDFVYEWPLWRAGREAGYTLLQAPIPVELPELPMRIASDWADHRPAFLSVRWTFSEGTVYFKQVASVTSTHWTNPLISEEHEDPPIDGPAVRKVVRKPPSVSGYLSDILALDILKPYPVSEVDFGTFGPGYRPSSEGLWELLGSLV